MLQRSLYYFWPGLPHLWLQGNLGGLAVAIGYSLFGNSLLLLTFVSPLESGAWLVWLGWPLFVVGWVVGVRRQIRRPISSLVSSPADSTLSDQLLLNAQRAYLERQWSEAVQFVDELIERDSSDIASRLLRVAVLRRTGEGKRAFAELQTLSALDTSEVWHYEIEHERRQLRELESADPSESSEKVEVETAVADSESSQMAREPAQEASTQITSYDSTHSEPLPPQNAPRADEQTKSDGGAGEMAMGRSATETLSNSDQDRNNSTSQSTDGDPRHSSRHAA